MQTRRNAAASVVAIAAILALASCVQASPPVIPTAEPNPKPVFASNAAALAAAKTAYAGYLEASDEVAHDGGDGVDRLQQWDTASQYKRDSKSLATMKADGHHTTGASTFSDASLESSDVLDHKAAVVAYFCLRIGGTQLLDNSGANVGANRPLALPLEVSFVSSSANAKTLLIDRSVGWSGANFCS